MYGNSYYTLMMISTNFQGVKAKVAIGGLSGSRYFATNVGNMANRTLFVKTVVDFTNKYKLDGLDFEYVCGSLTTVLLIAALAGNTLVNLEHQVIYTDLKTRPTSCLSFKNFGRQLRVPNSFCPCRQGLDHSWAQTVCL